MAYNAGEYPSKKLLLIAALAILFTLAGTAGIFYYLGFFNRISLKHMHAPAYRLVYLAHSGPYNTLQATFEKVAAQLDKAHIRSSRAGALLLDDPSVVAAEQLRSKVGYLISAQDIPPASLQFETVAEREVISAYFMGTPVIGSYKAYPAMKEWSNRYGYKLKLPSLEIYHDDGKVEYQLAITK